MARGKVTGKRKILVQLTDLFVERHFGKQVVDFCFCHGVPPGYEYSVSNISLVKDVDE